MQKLHIQPSSAESSLSAGSYITPAEASSSFTTTFSARPVHLSQPEHLSRDSGEQSFPHSVWLRFWNSKLLPFQLTVLGLFILSLTLQEGRRLVPQLSEEGNPRSANCCFNFKKQLTQIVHLICSWVGVSPRSDKIMTGKQVDCCSAFWLLTASGTPRCSFFEGLSESLNDHLAPSSFAFKNPSYCYLPWVLK